MAEPVTPQEAIDRNWQHFIVKGNPPGMNDTEDCVLRGGNGARCAVGLLIPDDEYRPELENLSVYYLLEKLNGRSTQFSSPLPSLSKLSDIAMGIGEIIGVSRFLTDLQNAHDIASEGETFREEYESALRLLAAEYTLDIPG